MSLPPSDPPAELPLLVARDADSPAVAVITFNRPAARNALTTEAMTAFADAVAGLSAQADLRAVILTGAGDQAFCSGADIAEMVTLTSEADAEAMIRRMGDALRALERLPVPVIAAINGFALGGGAEIALACDLRVIDAAARVGFVQIRRGLIPGWGGGQRLLRCVGYARACDILLGGRILEGEALVALGLAAEVAPQGGALPAALALARGIAAHEPAAVTAVKRLLQAGLTLPYDDALEAERALFPALWVNEARLQSMQDFVKGRSA